MESETNKRILLEKTPEMSNFIPYVFCWVLGSFCNLALEAGIAKARVYKADQFQWLYMFFIQLNLTLWEETFADLANFDMGYAKLADIRLYWTLNFENCLLNRYELCRVVGIGQL